MKKIILFGASGDTGKYFVNYFQEELKNNEFEIIAVGTRATGWFEKRGVQYVRMDITQREQFKKLPTIDVYAVIHLAGVMPARMKGYNPQKYIDVNITGTLNILEYCKQNSVDRILFAQSFGDIKDNAEKNILLSVDLPRKFSFTSDHSVYVMTKNFAVDLIENYHQMYGLKKFIFRLPTIYLWSPEDHYYVDGIQKKIGYRILIDKAKKGEELEIWGDPDRKKDMVYVKDFCQMLFLSLFVDRNEGYYNVGSGIGTSLEEQVEGIAEIFNKDGKISKITYHPEKDNAPQYIMDINPAKKELGYVPQYNYLKMLKDIQYEMINKTIED